ncbi:MAG: hypothetical protein HN909_00590 [Phycisphaerales bacterium]|jgi:G3E family GTPase|nr:hypothetical protein [Phycisphaerales bacterium]MBT7170246.1 hypothetical protein [Phycisphaerales bacterium]
MDLLIVSGFLGAGKTSVLAPLAKFLIGRGMKLAIIENEIGETGIDDVILREADLPVRELYSGCICCSLRIDLLTTLMEIQQTHAPDLVIVEPSGVAGPRQVVDAARAYEGDIERILVLTLLDAERLEKLGTIQLPFITNGIEAADLLVLNKIDAIDDATRDTLTRQVLDIAPAANLLYASAKTGENLDAMQEWLLNALDRPPVDPREAHPAPHASDDDSRPRGAVVFSHTARLNPVHAIAALSESLRSATHAFLVQLLSAGCTMIGHVKAVATHPEGGYLLVSATDFDAPISVTCTLDSTEQLSITLNAIVFDIDRARLGEIATAAFAPLLDES